MTPSLSSAQQKTYDAILGQPAPHNLQWRDVRSMLGAMAEVVEEPNGNAKVSRNGRTLLLHPERHKDVGSPEQIKELRAFLRGGDEESNQAVASGVHLLVVIDHRQARVYKTELRGTVPERIEPFEPGNSGRHLHYMAEDSGGQRRPELRSYYEAISKSLHGAEGILIFGSGTGASSAMDQLVSELKLHHKDLASRLVGAVVVDNHHETEDQLLARARGFYAEKFVPPGAIA